MLYLNVNETSGGARNSLHCKKHIFIYRTMLFYYRFLCILFFEIRSNLQDKRENMYFNRGDLNRYFTVFFLVPQQPEYFLKYFFNNI